MKINEITIDIPIKIKLDGNTHDINIGNGSTTSTNQSADKNSVMLGPLQQELELKKSMQGKESPVIDSILDDEDIGDDQEYHIKNLENMKILAGMISKLQQITKKQ